MLGESSIVPRWIPANLNRSNFLSNCLGFLASGRCLPTRGSRELDAYSAATKQCAVPFFICHQRVWRLSYPACFGFAFLLPQHEHSIQADKRLYDYIEPVKKFSKKLPCLLLAWRHYFLIPNFGLNWPKKFYNTIYFYVCYACYLFFFFVTSIFIIPIWGGRLVEYRKTRKHDRYFNRVWYGNDLMDWPANLLYHELSSVHFQ